MLILLKKEFLILEQFLSGAKASIMYSRICTSSILLENSRTIKGCLAIETTYKLRLDHIAKA